MATWWTFHSLVGAPNILERDLGYEIGGGIRLETHRRIHVDGQGGLLEARRLVQIRVCGQETTQLGHPEREQQWG